ncbi:MAG: hypothetical protein PVH88_14265 [Ignavibacteria bacterium]
MKTIVKLIPYLLLVMFFCNSIFSQSGDVTKQKTGYKTARVKKQVYPDDTYDFFSETSIDYGTYIPEDPETEASVYLRAIWDFNLPTDLPEGAYAKTVVLRYNGNSYDFFRLGYIANYPSNPSLQDKWDLIDNADELGDYIGANGSIVSTGAITALPEKIQAAHQAGKSKVYLSFKANNDLVNRDLVTLSELTLEITYEIRVTITADNNFTDNSGTGTHGSIQVDGGTETAPLEFDKVAGQSAVLGAVSPQTDNAGYQRIWHTGDADKSEWRRNGVFKSYDQSYSFEVTADDYDATYQAQLRQIRVTTRGTMSSNETWFTEVELAGNVTVPSGITLSITEDAAVNLGGYSIISTGGTLTISSSATINGLRARLEANTVLRGLCGLIQTAADYAEEVNEIVLEDGNLCHWYKSNFDRFDSLL